MANTPNLGLHQWQPDDSFLREDFNTDFGKIDTAVGTLQATMPRVLLREHTTTAAAQTVNLSLTDIDWASYWQVIIYVSGSGSTAVAGYVRFNKKSSPGDYRLGSSQAGLSDSTAFGVFAAGYDGSRITLECAGNAVTGTSMRMSMSIALFFGAAYSSAIPSLSALTELNLVPYDSQVSLPAGPGTAGGPRQLV